MNNADKPKQMELLEIVNKLVGKINPIGETNTDNERFENLQQMCDLVNKLVTEIDYVAYVNRDAYEFSKKRSRDFASEFLTKTLGISTETTELLKQLETTQD